MTQKTISVNVESNIYDLAEALKKLSLTIKDALKDGFQPGTDLPVIVTAAVADLVPVLAGSLTIGNEINDNPEAALTALLIPIKELVFELAKK